MHIYFLKLQQNVINHHIKRNAISKLNKERQILHIKKQ